MNSNPLDLLLNDLGGQAASRRHADVVFGTTGGRYEIKPSEFVPIVLDSKPRRMAFVDGGNGLLAKAPNYLILMNRACYVMFEGERRLPPGAHMKSSIWFFSCVVPRVGDSEIVYDTRIYAQDQEAVSEYLPEPDDLLSGRDKTTSVLRDSSPIASLARRLTEIRIATKVVRDELNAGDMLVLDGSLQTSFAAEKRYADRLYLEAEERGVIVCGLAKTTRLLTESGDPLMARVAEIAQDVKHPRWYVPVAERITEDGRGFVLAVRLHPNSGFVYRLEILRSQFLGMSSAEKDAVMCSLALNSRDVAMPGYPYGAVVADKFAQVRNHESAMYARLLQSRGAAVHEWRRLAVHSASIAAHDALNRVTG